MSKTIHFFILKESCARIYLIILRYDKCAPSTLTTTSSLNKLNDNQILYFLTNQ